MSYGDKAPMAPPRTDQLLQRIEALEKRVAQLEGQHEPAVPKVAAIPLCAECGEGAGLVVDNEMIDRTRLICVRCDVARRPITTPRGHDA